MRFSRTWVGAILHKELRDYRRNRFVIGTMDAGHSRSAASRPDGRQIRGARLAPGRPTSSSRKKRCRA
jgi:hypothetical protein